MKYGFGRVFTFASNICLEYPFLTLETVANKFY